MSHQGQYQMAAGRARRPADRAGVYRHKTGLIAETGSIALIRVRDNESSGSVHTVRLARPNGADP
jgi:hypothetical protein